MKGYRSKWCEYKGFIIGWDSKYLCYGVWEKEPYWGDYNCIGAYHKTIEQARQEIDTLTKETSQG